MSYEVALTDKAQSQLDAAYEWWAKERSIDQAVRWYGAFVEAIATLAERPQRCAKSPEAAAFSYEIRDLHFGLGRRPSHRAVFAIRENLVLVLAIRHLAQREITTDDV